MLDYGLLADSPVTELEGLLRDWCSRLVAEGTTHLSLFFRRGSRAEPLFTSLAEQVVEVEFQCGLAEPATSVETGVYVDHIYF